MWEAQDAVYAAVDENGESTATDQQKQFMTASETEYNTAWEQL
jgi:hypothetical protein